MTTICAAVRIAVDGKIAYLVTLEDDPAEWLKTLQNAVGGYIEVVAIPSDATLCLVVDEEGRLKELDVNETASRMAEQCIFGPAVLLPRALLA